MEVQVAGSMGLAHLRRVEPLEPVGRADVARQVIVEPLEAEGHVGVLRHLPVAPVEVAIDERDAGGVGDGAERPVLLAIDDVRARGAAVRAREQHLLDDVLDPLHRRCAREGRAGDGEDAQAEPLRLVVAELAGGGAGLGDRGGYPRGVERNDSAVSLGDGVEREPLGARGVAALLGGHRSLLVRSTGTEEGPRRARPFGRATPGTIPPSHEARRSNHPGSVQGGRWQVFGLASAPARRRVPVVRRFPARAGTSACGGPRSRLPLRGSPGFAPGSLLGPGLSARAPTRGARYGGGAVRVNGRVVRREARQSRYVSVQSSSSSSTVKRA